MVVLENSIVRTELTLFHWLIKVNFLCSTYIILWRVHFSSNVMLSLGDITVILVWVGSYFSKLTFKTSTHLFASSPLIVLFELFSLFLLLLLLYNFSFSRFYSWVCIRVLDARSVYFSFLNMVFIQLVYGFEFSEFITRAFIYLFWKTSFYVTV